MGGTLRSGNSLGLGALILSSAMGSTAGESNYSSLNELESPSALVVESTLPSITAGEFKARTNFQKLSESEQEMALALLAHLPDSAKDSYVSLLEKTIDETGKPALVDTDFKGGNLLLTLGSVVDRPMHPILEAERDRHITSFLKELAEPGELDQRGRGVCGTTVIYFIYDQYPAEGARLMAGLLSEDGAVELRTDGITAKRAPFWHLPYAKPFQSTTEMLVTTSLMDVGNGADESYCAHCDKSFDVETGKISKGLSSEEQRYLWNCLFGTDQTVNIRVEDYVDSDSSLTSFPREEVLEELLKRAENSLCGISLLWKQNRMKDDWSSVRHPLLPSLHDGEGAHLFDHRELPEVKKDTSHAVLLVGVDEDSVSFKNLQRGATRWPAGHTFEEPVRIVKDPSRNIQTMDMEVFRERLKGFLALDVSVLGLR